MGYYFLPSFFQLVVESVSVKPFRHFLYGIEFDLSFLPIDISRGALVLYLRFFLEEKIVNM